MKWTNSERLTLASITIPWVMLLLSVFYWQSTLYTEIIPPAQYECCHDKTTEYDLRLQLVESKIDNISLQLKYIRDVPVEIRQSRDHSP